MDQVFLAPGWGWNIPLSAIEDPSKAGMVPFPFPPQASQDFVSSERTELAQKMPGKSFGPATGSKFHLFPLETPGEDTLRPLRFSRITWVGNIALNVGFIDDPGASHLKMWGFSLLEATHKPSCHTQLLKFQDKHKFLKVGV